MHEIAIDLVVSPNYIYYLKKPITPKLYDDDGMTVAWYKPLNMIVYTEVRKAIEEEVNLYLSYFAEDVVEVEDSELEARDIQRKNYFLDAIAKRDKISYGG